jgi:hypothetical protein
MRGEKVLQRRAWAGVESAFQVSCLRPEEAVECAEKMGYGEKLIEKDAFRKGGGSHSRPRETLHGKRAYQSRRSRSSQVRFLSFDRQLSQRLCYAHAGVSYAGRNKSSQHCLVLLPNLHVQVPNLAFMNLDLRQTEASAPPSNTAIQFPLLVFPLPCPGIS